MDNRNSKYVIVGCGPAGLSAAYELTNRGEKVVCIEKDNTVGGISRTVCRNGFRFDIGGHRFFTKIKRVDSLWREVLGDDFLRRPRLSRIYYNGKFFDYPLKPLNALSGLGLFASIAILKSFIASRIRPYKEEKTFEHWVSNRFGKKLYKTFFKTYTEKVWGIPCSQIDAEWAAQRIKGLSLYSAIKAALFGNRHKSITTLIDEFDYPRFGPGQMYEAMAQKIKNMGGEILLNTEAMKVKLDSDRVLSIEVAKADGSREVIEGTDFISSAPITDLVQMIRPKVSSDDLWASSKLAYRSLLMVNLMLTSPSIFPDTWIYIHSPEVKVGRVQCFNNWSPYMVPSEEVCSIGLEYFCRTGDEFWNKSDDALIELGKKEAERLGLINIEDVFDAFVVRCDKAYPIYSTGYRRYLERVRNCVDGISNLQCIGRNGMFKYNNMDHSILAGLLAVDNIFGATNDLWAVNTEDEYHEEKRETA